MAGKLGNLKLELLAPRSLTSVADSKAWKQGNRN